MTSAAVPRVLVVGGYGAFGARVAERLARSAGLDVIVAGRNGDKAREAANQLIESARAKISNASFDAARPDEAKLRWLAPRVIVNASGPFQAQDYALANAAISVGAHYVDLADARTFVTGIGVLDAAAKAANVLVTSGASSVPALAAAIVDHHQPDFARLQSIEHGITPANQYDPGVATTASILSAIGQPIPTLIDGTWTTRYGWLGLRRHEFPGLGPRYMADCDVPDVALFPKRYQTVTTVRFCAGLEVTPFQLALWAMAAAAQRGILRRPERFATALMAIKRRLRFLGSDSGGMFVRLSGKGRDLKPLVREVHLIARRNEGPYVPAIAAVIIARKLALGTLETRGAIPCLGLMRLPEFTAEVADLAIEITHRNL